MFRGEVISGDEAADGIGARRAVGDVIAFGAIDGVVVGGFAEGAEHEGFFQEQHLCWQLAGVACLLGVLCAAFCAGDFFERSGVFLMC